MDEFDNLYKERIAALLRVMYATKYVKDDNVPAQIEEVNNVLLSIKFHNRNPHSFSVNRSFCKH